MAYGPFGSTRGGGGRDRDPRDRERPEIPQPPTDGGGDGEMPPETVPPDGGGGEGGGPSTPKPTPSVPGSPIALPSITTPGSNAGLAAYRTPAFFTSRFVGGPQLGTSRIGPGTTMTGIGESEDNRQPAQLDEETLRQLIARFGSVLQR